MNLIQIPDGVRRFIRDHISTADQLDILLYLHGRPGERLTAEAVGAAVFTVSSAATVRLEQLVESGLVCSEGRSNPVYYYAPTDPAVAQGVDDLAAAYRANRVGVIKEVFSQPTDPMSSFADAFRLRKDS